MLALYISSSSFSVIGDLTSEFSAGRRVKCDCAGDGIVYATIQSSAYSSPNTIVTIEEGTITSNLSTVLYGIVNIGASGSFPKHDHSSTEGQGGAISFNDLTDIESVSTVNSFLDLTDTPSTYSEGKLLISTSSGISYIGTTELDIQSYYCAFSVYDDTGGGDHSMSTDEYFRATDKHFDTDDAYSISNRYYVVPRSGLWLFTWTNYSNTSITTANSRVYIKQERDSTLIRSELTGAYAQGRSFMVSLECEIGDIVYMTCGLYSLSYYASKTHNNFSGILLNSYTTDNYFTDLEDTPSTYSGTEGLYAQSTGSGIVWAAVSGGDVTTEDLTTLSGALQTQIDNKPTTLLGLTDIPTPVASGVLRRNDTNTGYEWVNFPRWINRGYFTSHDFEIAGLTTDDAWHDLDLSSIVPSAAIFVILYSYISGTVSNLALSFRENGSSNSLGVVQNVTQAAGVTIPNQCTVPCDSNNMIEYRATDSADWVIINISVVGWYLGPTA